MAASVRADVPRGDESWASSDFTISEPSGTSDGDVLIAVFAVDHVGARDITEASGSSDWTELFDLQSDDAHMWGFKCNRGASAPNLDFSRDSGWISWAVWAVEDGDFDSTGYTTDEDTTPGKAAYTPGTLGNAADAAVISAIIGGNQYGSVSGTGYDSEDFDDLVFSNYLFAGYHDDTSVGASYSPGAMTLSAAWHGQAVSIYVDAAATAGGLIVPSRSARAHFHTR